VLDVIAAIYLLGLVFFGGLTIIALRKMGGIKGFADYSNRLIGKERPLHYIEWVLVMAVVFWPVLLIATIRPRRGS
jgi:hypothetical protein